MADDNRPYAKNVPGSFYVLDGCCMSCDVPVSVAPDVFSYDETNHCYVKRQPCAKDEIDRTLRAAWGSEADCIRYRGSDAEVLRRFAEFGSPHLCDVPPPPDIRPVVRTLVTFGPASPDHARLSAIDLAQLCREYLLGLNRELEGLDKRFRYRVRVLPVTSDPISASLAYSSFKSAWVKSARHMVEFREVGAPAIRWLIRHFSAERAGGRGVSNELDGWLKGAGAFCHIRWYSAEEWAVGGPGRETPL